MTLDEMLEKARETCVYCQMSGGKFDCSCQQNARAEWDRMCAETDEACLRDSQIDTRMGPEDVGCLAHELAALLSRIREASENPEVDAQARVALAQAVSKLAEADAILTEGL